MGSRSVLVVNYEKTEMYSLFPSDYYDEVDRRPIYYIPVQCPVKRCRGADCPVTSTRGKVREHKCKQCGYCFKSVEPELLQPEIETISIDSVIYVTE